MLISLSQLDALASSRFLDQLKAVICQSDPTAAAAFEAPEGQAELRRQCERARSYGLLSELDLARFVICAWLLGRDFDTRFSAMSEVLRSTDLFPSEKGEAIEAFCVVLFKTLAADHG